MSRDLHFGSLGRTNWKNPEDVPKNNSPKMEIVFLESEAVTITIQRIRNMLKLSLDSTQTTQEVVALEVARPRSSTAFLFCFVRWSFVNHQRLVQRRLGPEPPPRQAFFSAGNS